MKDHWNLVWKFLLVLSVLLLVESESEIRYCGTLSKATERCQGEENDAEFQNGLKKWRIQRVETIKTLKDVRDKLDTLCVSANYGKGAGTGAQLVGSVASIVGSFMELGGLASYDSVMGIADMVYHSGSLVEGVSGIAETLGSEKYLSDAEKVLRKDQELSATLGDRLETWNSLDQKIQEIFGFGPTSERRENLLNVLREFSRIQAVTRDFKKTADYMKSGEYSTYIAKEIRPEAFLKLINYMETNPQVSVVIRMGIMGVNHVPALVQSYRKLVGKEISQKMAAIPQVYKPPKEKEVAQYACLRSIDVAANFIFLLDAAKIIKEGKSKYSDSLKEIIDILDMELKNTEGL